jgi:N-acyl-D-aspartate/D-glutamate deacylase
VERLQPAGAIYFHMVDSDVRLILAHPRCMIGSDGLPRDRHPHPRLWGTFPRFLALSVREGLVPPAEAIRRMTSLPASVFGLAGRGPLAPGRVADLVLLDLDRVGDRATYEDPTRPAEGVAEVLVGGVRAWPPAPGDQPTGRFLAPGTP